MYLNKFTILRLVTGAREYIFKDICRRNFSNLIVKRELNVSAYKAMAQRSITSFFKFTPLKSAVGKTEDVPAEEETSPTPNGKEKVKNAYYLLTSLYVECF